MRIILEAVGDGASPVLGEFAGEVIRLGAAAGNDVVLSEARGFRVDPHQAEICVESSDRITLHPVSRTVPTRLNGRAVPPGDEAPLRHGDRIVFGDSRSAVRFTFRMDSVSEVLPAGAAAGVGPQTLRALIGNALAASRPARGLGRTSVFVRSVYDNLQHAHRRLKLWFGAALLAVAALIGGVGWGVVALSRSVARMEREKFQDTRVLDLQKRYARSVVLVRTRYRFRDPADGRTKTVEATGTGFYVDGRGGIVTAKHVVQPWKFPDGEAKGLAAPEASEVRYFVHEPGGVFDPDQPTWGVENSRVELVGTAPDVPLAENPLYHTDRSNGDLALLRVPGIESVPISFPEKMESAVPAPSVESVVTLGYPKQTSFVNETLSPMVASEPLRRVDSWLHLGGTIQGGFSGAPVVNRRGELIGVAVGKIAGETGMGYAIRVEQVRDLLDAFGTK